MALILESQSKILQRLSQRYNWRTYVTKSTTDIVPATITRRRRGSSKAPVLSPAISFNPSDSPDIFVVECSKPAKSKVEVKSSKKKAKGVQDITENLGNLFLERDGEDSINSDTNRSRRSIECMKTFGRTRQQLSIQMYKKYNEKIFKNQLPPDLPIIWNKNLMTTAGRAFKEFNKGIELSSKVIDTKLRLRDTLLHEMCHIAVYCLPTVFANRHAKPHGVEFWQWATIVNDYIPRAVNARCHNYEIFKPYKFICSNTTCNQTFFRHSKKGLDIDGYVVVICCMWLYISLYILS